MSKVNPAILPFSLGNFQPLSSAIPWFFFNIVWAAERNCGRRGREFYWRKWSTVGPGNPAASAESWEACRFRRGWRNRDGGLSWDPSRDRDSTRFHLLNQSSGSCSPQIFGVWSQNPWYLWILWRCPEVNELSFHPNSFKSESTTDSP